MRYIIKKLYYCDYCVIGAYMKYMCIYYKIYTHMFVYIFVYFVF